MYSIDKNTKRTKSHGILRYTKCYFKYFVKHDLMYNLNLLITHKYYNKSYIFIKTKSNSRYRLFLIIFLNW